MRNLTMQLNAPYSGPQAWFLHALRQGYLAEAGVNLTLIEGNGAYNAANNHIRGQFDLSYGDIYALAEAFLEQGEAAPVCIYATFRRSAAAIAVRADGPIRTLDDLKAARLIGHSSDVALQTFPAFAQAALPGSARPQVQQVEGTMAELFGALEPDQGLFGYVSTITSSLVAAGQSPDTQVRWFRYCDALPEFYGSGLMASRTLAQQEPNLLRAIVQAFNLGLRETISDPDAGIKAVLSFSPGRSAVIERLRWTTTLAEEMRPTEGSAFGQIDPARLEASLRLHCLTKSLGPAPTAAEVFSDAFLPAAAERFDSAAQPDPARP